MHFDQYVQNFNKIETISNMNRFGPTYSINDNLDLLIQHGNQIEEIAIRRSVFDPNKLNLLMVSSLVSNLSITELNENNYNSTIEMLLPCFKQLKYLTIGIKGADPYSEYIFKPIIDNLDKENILELNFHNIPFSDNNIDILIEFIKNSKISGIEFYYCRFIDSNITEVQDKLLNIVRNIPTCYDRDLRIIFDNAARITIIRCSGILSTNH